MVAPDGHGLDRGGLDAELHCDLRLGAVAVQASKGREVLLRNLRCTLPYTTRERGRERERERERERGRGRDDTVSV